MSKLTIDELAKWHEQLVATKKLIKEYKETSKGGVLAHLNLSAMVLPTGKTDLERTVGNDKSLYIELKRDVQPVIDNVTYLASIDIEESSPVKMKIFTGLDKISVNPIYMQELQTIMLKIMDDAESILDSESKKLQAEVEKSFEV